MAKTAAKATTKAGARELAETGAKAVAKAVRSQVDEIVQAGAGVRKAIADCFPAGTLISTEDGPLPIEELRNGMRVWAFDVETGEIELKRVRSRQTREVDTTTIVHLADETIETTEQHPFYTKSGWCLAGELTVGDELRTRQGHWHKVLRVEFRFETKPVYSFEVADHQNYFVGNWEWLVHNKLGSKLFRESAEAAGKGSDNLAGRAGKNTPNAKKKGCGDPVDMATGAMFDEVTDFELPGPLPLRWERYYYSNSTYAGPVGYGWHHAYDMRLSRTRSGDLELRLADGRTVSFPALHVGQRSFITAEQLTLRHDGRTYVLIDHDYREYLFDAEAVNTKAGAALQRISRHGAKIRFRYDARGYLESITDSAGRYLPVHTDNRGRVTAVYAPHPGHRYHPDLTQGDPHIAPPYDREYRRQHKNDATPPANHFPLIRYTYDNGKLVTATDPLNNPTRYAYKGRLMVRRTDRGGLSFYWEWDGRDHTAKCVYTWGDGGIHAFTFEYDTKNRCTTAREANGGVQRFHYNDAGLVTKTVDALGGVTEKTYDEHRRLLGQTDAIGRETRYEYDESSNLTAVHYPDGTAVKLEYVGHLLVRAEDQNGNYWKWKYNERCQLIERWVPGGAITSYDYEGPHLTHHTDGLKNRSELFYDPAGNLVAIVDAEGQKTSWEYDVLGRPLRVVSSTKATETRKYNLRGDLLKLKSADGNVTRFEYDARENPTLIKDRQREVKMEYTGTSRLGARVENETRVEFTYDGLEELVGIVNEHGYAYRFERDLNGRVISESSFDGLTKRYERDPAGQVAAVVRPGNKRTRYDYDRAGRPVSVRYWDGSEESYTYRADGALSGAGNAGAKVTWERDALGRPTVEVRDGHRIESSYNVVGGRKGLRSSLGADVVVRRDRFGQVIGVRQRGEATAWQASLERDALGLEIDRYLPGGVRSRWQRDQLGRPLRQVTTAGGEHERSRTYEWGLDDRLRTLTISGQGRFEFEHDAVGNLAAATYPGGGRDLRLPDAVGNLYRSADRGDREYGPAGQLLRSGTTHYTYDPDGNLTQKQDRFHGQTWNYTWNAAGMLTTLYRPDGRTVHFTYDALGRRLSKRFGAEYTQWLWDGDVPLHEWKERLPEHYDVETGESFADLDAAVASLVDATNRDFTTWLFEPDGHRPMAKLSGRERLSIITDHLGTPVAAYDGSGVQRFSRSLDIYGGELAGEGSPSIPFRYPGQYFDVETGLSYNRFRYYDPGEGVYLSVDPIGLAGGNPTLYGYVGDVNGEVDVFGLNCKQFNKGKTITDRWVDKLTGKTPDDVDTMLTNKGFTKSYPQAQNPNAIQHTAYTRTTKSGDTYILDYHPGGGPDQVTTHGTEYWKIYKEVDGSKVVYGRIAPDGFHSFNQITNSPVYANKVLMNG